MFSRRNGKSLQKKVKDFFWPSIGWKKTILYYKNRIFRIPDSSHALSMGVAVGVAVSFTPFIGLHLILTALFCYLTRGNILAGMFGTLIGNPTTFPIIWVASYITGCFILGIPPDFSTFEGVISYDFLTTHLYNIFLPMAIMGIVFGLIAGLITYYSLKKIIDKFQQARQERKKNAAERRKKVINIIKEKLPFNNQDESQ